MDPGDTLLGLLACAAGLVCGLYWGTRELVRLRLIENTATAKVRSAAQGYVELEGRAELMPGETIRAPLSFTPCVWWHYTVAQKQTHHRRHGWSVIRSSRSDDLFFLNDGTGTCIVDADGATVTPSVRHTWYGNHPQPDLAPKAGAGFLRAMFCNYRYTEEMIPVGHPLYALGWFQTQATHQDPQDENVAVRERMSEWKRDAQKMKLFDVNRDGRVDVKEWEAARRVALQKVRAQALEHATHPDFHVLRRPPDGRAFLISGMAQATLVKRLRWGSALGYTLAVAAAASSVPLWGLL